MRATWGLVYNASSEGVDDRAHGLYEFSVVGLVYNGSSEGVDDRAHRL
jgi:hypothetical protein